MAALRLHLIKRKRSAAEPARAVVRAEVSSPIQPDGCIVLRALVEGDIERLFESALLSSANHLLADAMLS